MSQLDFSTRRRRPPRDSIIPMINIVFLMLIFFLMTATLTPDAPIEVRPPSSIAEDAVEKRPVLFIGADGSMAFGDEIGGGAFDAFIAAAVSAEGGVQLRADRALPGKKIASILARLGAQGVTGVELIVGRG